MLPGAAGAGGGAERPEDGGGAGGMLATARCRPQAEQSSDAAPPASMSQRGRKLLRPGAGCRGELIRDVIGNQTPSRHEEINMVQPDYKKREAVRIPESVFREAGYIIGQQALLPLVFPYATFSATQMADHPLQ